jgi:hypothetical protein
MDMRSCLRLSESYNFSNSHKFTKIPVRESDFRVEARYSLFLEKLETFCGEHRNVSDDSQYSCVLGRRSKIAQKHFIALTP